MEKIKKIGFGAGITTCIIMLLLIVSNINQGLIEPPTKQEEWQTVQVWTPLGAEANPGAGASGFLEIFFMNLSSADQWGYGLPLPSLRGYFTRLQLQQGPPARSISRCRSCAYRS